METTITNVSDFLKWIKEHRSSEGEISFEQSNVYYRGHASQSWALTPSIFREPRICEYDAIRIATRRLWNKLSHCSYLERLIFFQHYGLKTRLMDVTFNPLIALFFACQETQSEKDSADGKVFYGYCNDDGSLRYADIVTEIVSTDDFSTNIIDRKRLTHIANKYNANARILENVVCNPMLVYPPYNSDRIIAQQGAFVMAPIFKTYDEENTSFQYRNEYTFDKDCNNQFFGLSSLIIPSKCKKDILEELETLNINDATVYPETEHQMKAINKKLEPKYELDV